MAEALLSPPSRVEVPSQNFVANAYGSPAVTALLAQAEAHTAAAAAVGVPAPAPAMSPPPEAGGASDARRRAEAEFRTWEEGQRNVVAASPVSVNLGAPAPTSHLPSQQVLVPLSSPLSQAAASRTAPVEEILRQTEDGLLATEKRVRAEADQLEATRRAHLAATEAESLRVRSEALTDIERQQRGLTQKRDEDTREMATLRAQLEEREAQLRQAELEHQCEVLRADDDLKMRALTTEETRRRTTQAIETRVRAELEAELRPTIRAELEGEVTARVTTEVQSRLQLEFQQMCATARAEVECAREQMHVEITQALEPVVEARLLPLLKMKAESEVQNSIVTQLQDTANAAARMRDELKAVAGDRDRLSDDMVRTTAAFNEEKAALRGALEEECAKAQQLAADLANAVETLQRFDEERSLYPLLKEVESIPGPWAHVNQQLDALKKQNAQLQADAQFSTHEIEMLRKQLMENMGGKATPLSPSRQSYAKQHTPRRAASPVPLLDSVQGHRTRGGERLFSASPQRQKMTAPVAEKAAIPCKNRFLHKPKKGSAAPTFPFRKEDRERIFFSEMEQLKSKTEKGLRGSKTPRGV